MTAGVVSSWYGYDSWRQATLKLNTVIPPLVVEVLDKDDYVVRVETAPMQNAVSFPQGDYQVRILKEGELSQTLDVALSRNTESSFSLDLHDQLLWTPRNLEQSFDVVDLSEGHGLVLWNEKGIGLRRNLELLSWSRELGAAQLPEPDKAAGFRWPWNQEVSQYSGYGHFDLRPWVAPQAVDVAGDGKGYLIVGARHQAWLMAVSSDDGAILWFAGRGHDVSLRASQPARYFDNCVKSAILSEPILTRDCNGDGVRDIIVTFVDIGPQPVLVRNRYTARYWIEAVSGKTGEMIWSYDLPAEWFELPPGEEVPYDLRWFAGWFTGADGWPQLIVEAVANEGGQNRSIVGLFSAGTGHLTKLGHNITALRPADMDGDQVDDLLVYNAKSPNALDRGGTLHCLRGVANEKWGRLGNAGQPSADLDGDGVRDLLAGWPSSILTAVSSRTGESLWHTQVEELGREFQVRAADSPSGHSGDLDGDGIVDLLGWIHPSYHNQTGTLFFALSGKTGRKLWTAPDITVQRLNSVIAAEAHDLDGDQKPEVIWLAVLDYGYPVRNSLSSNDCQLWVFVTSGQTGQLRWARPLSVAFGQTTGTMQVIASGAMIKPSIGDINGDGTSDLLVPRLTSDGRSFETQALSGKDGAPLWTRPFPVNLSQQPSFDQWIPPAICDLDSDGQQEVVLVELVKVDAAGNPIHPRYQVVAAQGRDGSEVWNWISQRTAEYWISASGKSRGELMRPQVLRVADEQPRVAVLLPGNEGTVVVFEADGKSHERLANYATSQAGIWPCDSDGDAIDEIAYLDGAMLCIVAGNKLDTPIWQRTLGYNGPHQIIGVLPGNSEKPPVIAVALDASDNSVLGFDAATGQRVWTCPGVISRDAGTYSVPSHVTLLDESRSPNVYYNYNAVSRCRRAVPTAQSQSEPSAFDAMDAKSWLTLRGGVPATIQRAKQIEDPRWERSLPWVSAQRSRTPKSETAITILWAIGFAGLLVVAPGAFLARLAIARRFGLRMLMILPVVAGLFLMACLVNVSHREFAGLWNRFSLGFGFSSVVIAIGMCVRWLIQGQWNRLGFWLGMTVIVSSILAAFALWNQAPMLPEEHYSLTDGYTIWFFGAFVTTWLLVIMLPIEYVMRWFWRGRRLKSVPLELRNSDSTIAANSPVKS